MENKDFLDIYNDKEFNKNVSSMLRKMYNHSQMYFQDAVIDFDDFVQEIWCQLFEAKRFSPDRALCMEIMKCDANDYIKNMRNRSDIVSFQEFDEETTIES